MHTLERSLTNQIQALNSPIVLGQQAMLSVEDSLDLPYLFSPLRHWEAEGKAKAQNKREREQVTRGRASKREIVNKSKKETSCPFICLR